MYISYPHRIGYVPDRGTTRNFVRTLITNLDHSFLIIFFKARHKPRSSQPPRSQIRAPRASWCAPYPLSPLMPPLILKHLLFQGRPHPQGSQAPPFFLGKEREINLCVNKRDQVRFVGDTHLGASISPASPQRTRTITQLQPLYPGPLPPSAHLQIIPLSNLTFSTLAIPMKPPEA